MTAGRHTVIEIKRRDWWRRLIAAGLVLACLGLSATVHAEKKGGEKKDPARVKQLETEAQRKQRALEEIRRKRQQADQRVKQANRSLWQTQRAFESKQRSLQYHRYSLSSTRDNLVFIDRKLDETVGEVGRLNETAALRLRSLYMGERLSLLQMVLEANDISTLLDRLYYKQRIVAHDKRLLASLKNKVEELNDLKVRLARQKEELDRTIRAIDVQTRQLKNLKAEKSEIVWKLKNDRQAYIRAENQLLAESNRIARELQALTGKANIIVQSTGAFIWPVRGRITSNFGYRWHPIHKVRKYHSGMDIGAPNRSRIKAADGGEVIFAGWRGGYGKAIMINHGNKNGKSIVTLYGHLSAIHVRKGQRVSKGQVIGLEGSTGYSTGPHLHFEVRENGSPVNPRNYLP